MATHNSYWVKRAKTTEPFASGTQERLLDQLLFDQARALEIDIHKIPGKKGQWAIYHTGRRKNVLFENFTDFLKQLQQFQYALPRHEVVTVVIELKEILNHNFDKKHTPAQFDSLLESCLGEYLFRPRDLMKRCPGSDDLKACVASSPEIWPTIQELRGKFIFLVLGNFRWSTIGHGGEGWVVYANSDNPSAFPMSSDFSHFNEKYVTSEKVNAKMLERAYKASVFRQVEMVNDTDKLSEARKFIAGGGIVRGADSYSIEEQQKRIAQGFHMLQTDFPWIHYGAKTFEQPFQPINTSQNWMPDAFTEPGNRIFLPHFPQGKLDLKDTSLFWSTAGGSNFNDWETLPSSTIPSPVEKYANTKRANGIGCLCMQDDANNFVRVCRAVTPNKNAGIIFALHDNDQWKVDSLLLSNDRTSGKVGDYIRMTVDNRNAGGSIVHIYSASEMEKDAKGISKPKWNLIHTQKCQTTFSKQGISASSGDVLFTGTKKNGVDVKPEDLVPHQNFPK
jgi:hypothetical protein